MKYIILIPLFVACASTDLTKITGFDYSQSVQGENYVIDIEAFFEDVRSLTMYVYEYNHRFNRFYGPLAMEEYVLYEGGRLEEKIYTNKHGVYLIVFVAAGREIGRKEITVVEVA